MQPGYQAQQTTAQYAQPTQYAATQQVQPGQVTYVVQDQSFAHQQQQQSSAYAALGVFRGKGKRHFRHSCLV